jgi:hypothetical protein
MEARMIIDIATARRMRMWPSFETASSIFDWANWFLLGALAIGVVSTGLVIWMGNIKEGYLRSDLSEARLDATHAVLQITILSKEIADANERAATAEQRAAEATLALAQFKSARSLSPEQQQRIADKLKPFAGTIFDAGIGPMGDPEPLYLLRSISAALSLAGWQFIAWTGEGLTLTEAPMPAIGSTMVTNVIVDVHPDRWERFGAAATTLAKALAVEGIDAIADSKDTSINTNAIHIRIGRKL